MSQAGALSLLLPSEEETARLAAWLARRLRPGDTLLLDGPIGAGKSHFARAFIRARLGRMEEVPSPSFTLVQTYPDAAGDLWHTDLYRLFHPDEVLELGLADAFSQAICLVEWPDRLGKLKPADSLCLKLRAEGEGRRATLDLGHRVDLLPALSLWAKREAARQEFVANAGWQAAERRFLAGDASDRSYDRLVRLEGTAVLMDAPPGKGDDPATFLAIADHLSRLGLSAPALLAKDLPQGFLLLEDFGDGVFARLIATDAKLERPLYRAATDVLVALQARPAAPGLTDLSALDWADAAAVALDWYRFSVTADRIDTAPFRQTLAALLTAYADGPRVMILRDYHAENLIWLPDRARLERAGLARVGLLDFQLAQMGQPGYDLVSLLQDARRDVSPRIEAEMVKRFVAATGSDPLAFRRAHAVLGAQRALRILGVFARLCLVAGKPGYLHLIPRVWAQLQRNLAQPELAGFAGMCRDLLPEPTPETLQKTGAQCGNFR